MKVKQSFTLVELLAVVLALVLGFGAFVVAHRNGRANESTGLTVTASDASNGRIHFASHVIATEPQRWVPINGQYLGSDLLLSPEDSLTKWTGATVTTANFSFAVLPIGDQVAAPIHHKP